MIYTVQFVVGNTYQKLPLSEARLDRSGTFRKNHDWTLFVDVLKGEPDIIERVSFDMGSSFQPQVFICSSPISVKRPDGTSAWRFSTRQQSYGPVEAVVKIRGAGGSITETCYTIILNSDSYHKKPPLQTFRETRTLRPLRTLKLAETQRFGIELELTSAEAVPPEHVAGCLETTGMSVHVFRNYSAGQSTLTDWKIVPDSSIVCSSSLPDCNKFELVSPVLQGGSGLSDISKILSALGNIEPKLKVNKSMGFHVHVDVSSLSRSQLVKVCQNFIKYEDVMDSLMPPSRRPGSPESDKFFQSNQTSVNAGIQSHHGMQAGNKQLHDALGTCDSIESLFQLMNRTTNDNSGRYYKLNLQNLVTGRQPTIEFRQHSATMSYDKVSAWLRFCVAFVANSARLASPSAFSENRSLGYQFDALFQYVIKDRALRNYYRERREKLQQHDDDLEDGACCSGCSSGGLCANKKAKVA